MFTRGTRYAHTHQRRGAVTVLAAVSMTLLLGFAALSVDVGRLYVARAELQNAADAAALAGVQELRGGHKDPYAHMDAARAWALEIALRNLVMNQQPSIDGGTNIEFGQAKRDEITGHAQFLVGEIPASAIRVTVHHDVNYTFAGVFGLVSRRVSATAAASIGARDFMIVIDCSGSMTKGSDEAAVAAELAALGISYNPVVKTSKKGKKGKNTAVKFALSLTYDGADPVFLGVYAVGEMFLPPSIPIQPLKATKDAAAYSVGIVEQAGYDDLIGAVAYATNVAWIEPLTTDYARVRAKLLGATKYGGTSLHEGIRAAREELLSVRSRRDTEKVIVLMTDGKSDSALALEQAQLAVDARMVLHCVGLGPSVDYALLDAIAALNDGVALYVNNATDEAVYGPALQQVFESIASNEVGIGLIQ